LVIRHPSFVISITQLAIALLLAGYALVMLGSPVRDCLRDGWRCVRRYPAMSRVLGALGFANALFQFSVQLTLHLRGHPQFTWVRAEWLASSRDLHWWIEPPSVIRESLDASWLPSLEALGGLFNIAVTTFPVAVLAACGLCLNRRRTLSLVHAALAKRLGLLSWPVLALIFVCGAAVIAKAALYFWRPAWLGDEGWMHWAQIVMSPAALFECAFGLGVQAWLLLNAYAWVRGMSFDRDAMRDVAIRRLGAMAKWAAIVLLAQSLFIELPLTLSLTRDWPAPPAVVVAKLDIVRFALAAALILCGSMQAWLTLHGETLPRAWRAHWQLVRTHWRDVFWFLLIAAAHLFAVNFLRTAILRTLGENTAPGIAWTLVWPWLAGLVTAWLVASWVCIFKKCEHRTAAA
jgi:hypothetical protein